PSRHPGVDPKELTGDPRRQPACEEKGSVGDLVDRHDPAERGLLRRAFEGDSDGDSELALPRRHARQQRLGGDRAVADAVDADAAPSEIESGRPCDPEYRMLARDVASDVRIPAPGVERTDQHDARAVR